MIRKLLILFILMNIVSVGYAQKTNVFSTWETLGADACASAWLIKRFVNQNATFQFYPKGELIEEGIPFDTPDAEIRRKANMSAYEVILKKYQIQDHKAIVIGEIIHEIELNAWAGNLSEDTEFLNIKIKDILKRDIHPTEKIIAVSGIMDDFYETMRIK